MSKDLIYIGTLKGNLKEYRYYDDMENKTVIRISDDDEIAKKPESHIAIFTGDLDREDFSIIDLEPDYAASIYNSIEFYCSDLVYENAKEKIKRYLHDTGSQNILTYIL